MIVEPVAGPKQKSSTLGSTYIIQSFHLSKQPFAKLGMPRKSTQFDLTCWHKSKPQGVPKLSRLPRCKFVQLYLFKISTKNQANHMVIAVASSFK